MFRDDFLSDVEAQLLRDDFLSDVDQSRHPVVGTCQSLRGQCLILERAPRHGTWGRRRRLPQSYHNPERPRVHYTALPWHSTGVVINTSILLCARGPACPVTGLGLASPAARRHGRQLGSIHGKAHTVQAWKRQAAARSVSAAPLKEQESGQPQEQYPGKE